MAPRKQSLSGTAADLNSAAIHLLRGMRAADRASGLTAARLSALSVLVFSGPTTLGGLASAEDVAPPTMTRIVDGLVSLGLAERTEHPESARSVLVVATGAGADLMRAAAARRVEVIVAALEALPAEQRRLVVGAAPALRALADDVPRRARELFRP